MYDNVFALKNPEYFIGNPDADNRRGSGCSLDYSCCFVIWLFNLLFNFLESLREEQKNDTLNMMV
jgi:hypothetical protein